MAMSGIPIPPMGKKCLHMQMCTRPNRQAFMGSGKETCITAIVTIPFTAMMTRFRKAWQAVQMS